MIPDVCACTGVIPTPFSTFFEMSKSSSELAMVKNSVASAKKSPGQTRRPNPKHMVRGSRCAGFSLTEISLFVGRISVKLQDIIR